MNNVDKKCIKRSTKLWYIAFTALAVLIMALPTVLTLAGVKGQNKEKRPLAREPELVVRGEVNLELPQDFDDYFQDHFALREEMVSGINALTSALAGDTLNKKTIVGRDMLFFADTLRDYQRADVMSEYDIARAARVLRIMSGNAKAHGQNFIFAVAPNKNTVYPENMPARYYVNAAASNRERLYAALEGFNVDTVDLAGLLSLHKGDGALYHAEDTHWNARGALIAYRAIMELAASGHYFDDYASAACREEYGYEGDLHNFILPAVSGKGAYPVYDIEQNFYYDEGTRIEQDTTFATNSVQNSLKLTVFRDSFAIALIPYISNNAERAVYTTEFPYNYTVSEAYEADSIIVELVERNIPNLILSAPVMEAVEVATPWESTLAFGPQAGWGEASEPYTVSAVPAPVAAEVSAKAYGFGLTYISGTFDNSSYDPARNGIYILVNGRYYEAFPVGAENGFAAYVNAGGEAKEVEVFVW